MIDGLKLTMTGVQLRASLEKRVRWYQDEMRRLSAADDDSAREAEMRRAQARIELLTFIRDYILADEVYRLGEFDLRFADLLPDDDVWEYGCLPYEWAEPGNTSQPS